MVETKELNDIVDNFITDVKNKFNKINGYRHTPLIVEKGVPTVVKTQFPSIYIWCQSDTIINQFYGNEFERDANFIILVYSTDNNQLLELKNDLEKFLLVDYLDTLINYEGSNFSYEQNSNQNVYMVDFKFTIKYNQKFN